MTKILVIIFIFIFIFSFPFPPLMSKIKNESQIDNLNCLDILIEEIKNGIPLLEAWAVARNGENFIDLHEADLKSPELRNIFSISKLSSSHGIALSPLLNSYRDEMLAKSSLRSEIEVEAASARATITLLAFLPLLLLILAQSTGLNIWQTFQHSVVSQFSFAVSITLQLLGRYWTKRMINATS